MNIGNHKSFYYPPGGILIWIIILLELVTFSAGIIAFTFQSNLFPEMYSISKEELNVHIGFANTLILLTSGFFIAQSLQHLKAANEAKSQNFMWVGMLFGLAFMILKSYEFVDKMEHGFDLSYNAFFMYYWLLTGFHFMHVLVGLIILFVLVSNVRKGVYSKDNFLDVEAGASFWHMCDLIWLILFPVLYLL